jgi:hypothetical protein
VSFFILGQGVGVRDERSGNLTESSLYVFFRHSRMLLAGIQPHGNPAAARSWIPAKSMQE